MVWPLLRLRAFFLPAPLPLPRFFPALLTLKTPFHNVSAGTAN